MLIISVPGIYLIPVYRGACPIVRRCGLSSDTTVPHSDLEYSVYITTVSSLLECLESPG